MSEISREKDDQGRLVIRLSEPFEPAPHVPGWKPYWVNRVADRLPAPQWIKYKPVSDD